MKRKALFSIVVVLVAVSLGLVVRWRTHEQPGRRRFDLNLGGPAGLRVAAAYEIDGQTNSFRGTTPTNIVLQAREISYTVQTLSNLVGLRVTLYVDDLPCVSTLAGTNGGVRGNCRVAADGARASAAGF